MSASGEPPRVSQAEARVVSGIARRDTWIHANLAKQLLSELAALRASLGERDATIAALRKEQQVMADVAEIRRLLFEAYDHYFATSDGHCKSSEGSVGVFFPNYFERDKSVEPSITVYSYVLGPHRDHYFGSIAEALAAVKEWHAAEMACTEER